MITFAHTNNINPKTNRCMKKLFTLISLALMAIGMNAQTLINYPTSTSGITPSGTTVEGTVKIHTNKDAVSCITLKNGYTTEGVLNENYILLETEGGFKTGDVITIAGAISNTDATKRATAVLFSSEDGAATEKIFQFDDFINCRLVNDDPVAQSYTLEADYAKLYLGRDGGTGANLTLIKVVRGDEDPGEEPGVEPGNEGTDLKVTVDCTTKPTQEEKDALAATRFSDDGKVSVLFENVNNFDNTKGIRIKVGSKLTVTVPEGGKIQHLLFNIGGSSSAQKSFWTIGETKYGEQKDWKDNTDEFDLPATTGNKVELLLNNETSASAVMYITGVTVSYVADTAVGIESVATAPRTTGTIYNLAGQRVTTTQKGLYIRDGKKFMK